MARWELEKRVRNTFTNGLNPLGQVGRVARSDEAPVIKRNQLKHVFSWTVGPAQERLGKYFGCVTLRA